jgi:hypothetical protein
MQKGREVGNYIEKYDTFSHRVINPSKMTKRMAVPNVVETKTLDYIRDYTHHHLGQVVSFNRTPGRKTKRGIGLA